MDPSIAVVRIRLAVARAGQRDGLAWWDDESLTPGADFLLRRLFPRTAPRAAHRLATLAARARHRNVLTEVPRARHLFDFGDETEYRLAELLRSLDHELGDAPRDPIASRDALGHALRAIAPEPSPAPIVPTDVQRAVRLGDELATLPLVERALALAWTYVRTGAGAGEAAVFPFYVPAAERTG